MKGQDSFLPPWAILPRYGRLFLKQRNIPMTLLAQCEEPRAASRLDDLLDLKAVCRFFGGTKPLHPATLYRGIAAKRYPAPIHVGPNASRWLPGECAAALQAMIAGRAAR